MKEKNANEYCGVNSDYMKEGPNVAREIENNQLFDGDAQGIEDDPLPKTLPSRKVKLGVD